MKSLVSLFILMFLFLGSKDTRAQIFQTKSQILEELGTPDNTGVADDGSKYISYETEYNTEASGKYTRHKVRYFVEMEDGTEVCNMWMILEPSTETNSFISYFRDNFVKTDYMEYKDYENEILYDVRVEDGICIVKARFDNIK
ncbi:hypothetical protein ACW6QP_04250 [Salegentibacter sp. HM20]